VKPAKPENILIPVENAFLVEKLVQPASTPMNVKLARTLFVCFVLLKNVNLV